MLQTARRRVTDFGRDVRFALFEVFAASNAIFKPSYSSVLELLGCF
jgi:hypothetical protein